MTLHQRREQLARLYEVHKAERRTKEAAKTWAKLNAVVLAIMALETA